MSTRVPRPIIVHQLWRELEGARNTRQRIGHVVIVCSDPHAVHHEDIVDSNGRALVGRPRLAPFMSSHPIALPLLASIAVML